MATAAEVVVQHLRGLTELRRGQVIDWIAEVRVIEDVEEIDSELKRKSFCEAELAAQRDVPLRGAESAQGVASEIALGGGRDRRRERHLVDDLPPGRAGWVKIERHAGNDVRALQAIRASGNGTWKNLPGYYIHRRSTADINDRVRGPVSKDLLQHHTIRSRNIVGDCAGKCVAYVVVGGSAFGGRGARRGVQEIPIA